MPNFTDYLAHGWALCRIEPGTKGPQTPGWSRREGALRSVEGVAGVGLMHAYSGTCAIDVDDMEAAAEWLDQKGISLAALITDPLAVRIERGDPNRTKLLYALDAPLPTIKPCRGLELRCGTRTGTTAQDVLPPSLHPSGAPYAWAYDDLLTDWRSPPPLPEALRTLWHNATSFHSVSESATAGDVDPEELRKLLVSLDPDMGYDAWLRVGMALHHATAGADGGLQLWDQWSSQGEKYVGFRDVAQHWRSFRLDTDTPVTVNSLRGLQVAGPDDFEPVVDEDAPERPENPYRFEPVADWLRRPPPEWLLPGVLPKAELAMVFGASGSGKTFWALDLCLVLLAGETWRGRRGRPLTIGWIAAEAAGSVRNRVAAWVAARSGEAPRLWVNGHTPNLGDKQTAQKVIEATREVGADVIVVDTLAAASGSANENSGEDMGAVINACRGIHRATGALVLLIHHSGKDRAKGARGWSGIRAALDTEIEIEDGEDGRAAVITKHRDGEIGETLGFGLVSFSVSCLVDQAEDGEE